MGKRQRLIRNITQDEGIMPADGVSGCISEMSELGIQAAIQEVGEGCHLMALGPCVLAYQSDVLC